MQKLIEPQLPTLAKSVPRGDDWIHEIKFDGYRLMVYAMQDSVRLITRNGFDWTRRFPHVARSTSNLPAGTVIDGELTAMTSAGVSDFHELQCAVRGNKTRALSYQAFDVLYLNGHDVRKAELIDRKYMLQRVVASLEDNTIGYSDFIEGNGPLFYEQVCELGLEGIVAKRASSSYQSGRTSSWLKVKCTKVEPFVIGGITRSASGGVSSLLLGIYREGHLEYIGRVKAPSNATLKRALPSSHDISRAESPFSKDVRFNATWLEPAVVVDVEYLERTAGGLRHAAFKRIRPDLHPSDTAQPR